MFKFLWKHCTELNFITVMLIIGVIIVVLALVFFNSTPKILIHDGL